MAKKKQDPMTKTITDKAQMQRLKGMRNAMATEMNLRLLTHSVVKDEELSHTMKTMLSAAYLHDVSTPLKVAGFTQAIRAMTRIVLEPDSVKSEQEDMRMAAVLLSAYAPFSKEMANALLSCATPGILLSLADAIRLAHSYHIDDEEHGTQAPEGARSDWVPPVIMEQGLIFLNEFNGNYELAVNNMWMNLRQFEPEVIGDAMTATDISDAVPALE